MYIYIIILGFTSLCVSKQMCRDQQKTLTPLRYHLISTCFKSQLTIIARANYMSLKRCEALAIQKNGLAYNFSPPSESSKVIEDDENPFKSCQILECPETNGITSLVYDPLYDYYSLYADPLPSANASCLSGVGILSFGVKQMNYTNAVDACAALGGKLADITSDSRTNGLSDLFSSLKMRQSAAFVGLDDIEQEGRYMTSNREDLTCTTFRAWAPGHPKKKRPGQDCVAIDKKRMWRVWDCERLLPYICELTPSGPFRPNDYNYTFPSGCTVKIDDKNETNKFDKENKSNVLQLP